MVVVKGKAGLLSSIFRVWLAKSHLVHFIVVQNAIPILVVGLWKSQSDAQVRKENTASVFKHDNKRAVICFAKD